MFFAEGEGLAHLHVHVVPRPPDVKRRGPSVVWYMDRPEAEWVSAAEMDALAAQVRERLATIRRGPRHPG
jgi:diadenosine tetraphosphate (Ap4A) HIT family hydrolase